MILFLNQINYYLLSNYALSYDLSMMSVYIWKSLAAVWYLRFGTNFETSDTATRKGVLMTLT